MVETTKKKDSNGFGIAALILGICGFGLAWIPFVGLFFIPLGVLAVIFGIISVAKTTAKGLGIAGIIIGGVSLIITIIMSVVLGVLIGTAATEINTNYDQYYNELNEINQILEDYDYNYNY